MKKAVPSEMPAAVPNWHSKAGGGEKKLSLEECRRAT